jgi:hypothetical protein
MDPAATVGFEVTLRFRVVVALIVLAASARQSAAADRYALVVTGAAGGDQYTQKYRAWRVECAAVLLGKLGYAEDHVAFLAEEQDPGTKAATRENVVSALADLRRRAVKDDLVLIVLIGHGTADGDEAKFNLVGPDLSADEWAALIKPIPGRVVFVDAASGSFPFLRKLAGPGRVVLTANDSVAQDFETVFPEFFLRAFSDPAADPDKNGRISVWEAFSYASAGVRQWFTQHEQLATERPLLDDTGAGIGREAGSPGPDGTLAQLTYLQAEAPIGAQGGEIAALLKERAAVEFRIEQLKAKKGEMPDAEYQAALEKLLLELGRIDSQLRPKS